MYVYENERPHVFTERGQVQFLSIRDRAKRLIDLAGAANMECIIKGETGDSWQMLACVDRLVEIGELLELTVGMRVAGQHRVFISTN